MVTDYRTEGILPHQRFEYWEEVVCRHCTPADSHPAQNDGFVGQMHVRSLGAITICTLNASEHHWHRRERHLRRMPDDVFYLTYAQNAQALVEQGDRRAVVKPGQLMLYDSEQSFRLTLTGPGTHLIRIPWTLIGDRVPGLKNRTAQVLEDARPGIMPLKCLIADLMTQPNTELSAISSRYSLLLLELLELGLIDEDLEHTKAERDLYGRIMDYIRQNVTDPQLGLESIARAHSVSTRTVSRTFARYQTSPMKVVWRERLRASRMALERGQTRYVSEVAMNYGFTDFSHFSRSFRREFGMSPRELLKP
ncbi:MULTISPECIES: AraC-like ligand-binding domain-containing protein [unclassified Mameliella]|uniref:AraC-like ligand-binding domain-containing protein n=1 Tax=Mameliella sp. LZ-28 TaxID=2484146 RepID=UPI00143F6F8D|nr:helix-turn-helix domain-containing protein [Mameliella sp. LZ-28]